MDSSCRLTPALIYPSPHQHHPHPILLQQHAFLPWSTAAAVGLPIASVIWVSGCPCPSILL